jgi:DNA-binding response OmpR family regulator
MKPHVLIVDDSLTVRMDLRAVLHEAGFFVTACETKASAQKALKARSYALVILDVILPDGNGIDLLKEIRANKDSAHTPVIMLSNESEVKHRIRGLTTGADEYVGKPYDSAYVARCARMLALGSGPSSSGSGAISEPPHTGKKILVVDDSPTYLDALAELLRQDGHDVVLAHSGEEALELLAVELVDAIILDLLMPGIGGLETCRRIRANSAQQHIPVMMLTGRDDREARAQGLAAGVDEFVVKSPELDLLKVRLRALLRKKRSEHTDVRGIEDRGPVSDTGLWRKQDEVPRGSLLYRVVMESGLSSVIGPTTIVRACKRVGIDARAMTAADLKRALPTIRETLGLFLTPEETEKRMQAIASLVKDIL